MRVEHDGDGHSKWWISGGAALFTHLAVMLALPDAPHGEALHMHGSLSEFEVTALATVHAHVAATQRADTDATRTPDTHSAQQAMRSSTARSRTAIQHAQPMRGALARRTEHTTSATASHEESVTREASAPAAVVPDARARSADSNVPGSLSPRALASAHTATEPARATSPLGALAAGGLDEAGRGGAHGGATGHRVGRAPGLLTAHNPCSGFFPATARVNQGAVQLSVHVDADGHTRAAHVLNELPAGQEFGRAARACAAALRFVPASNELGLPVAGEAKLELRFKRS